MLAQSEMNKKAAAARVAWLRDWDKAKHERLEHGPHGLVGLTSSDKLDISGADEETLAEVLIAARWRRGLRGNAPHASDESGERLPPINCSPRD